MEEKGLVDHRVEGRTFVYRPRFEREQTSRRLVGRMLDRLYDGAIDQLVDNLLAFRQPTDEELRRLEALVAQAKSAKKRGEKRGDNAHGQDG
jgi:predicted transcriptional regulator